MRAFRRFGLLILLASGCVPSFPDLPQCLSDQDCVEGSCVNGVCQAGGSDAGPADLGTRDGAVPDLGVRLDAAADAGPADVGQADAGALDSGALDSGDLDASDPQDGAGPEAGPDSGSDAGVDAGSDAGRDAAVDAGNDAAVDAGNDAGSDAGNDAGADAGSDGGLIDGGPPMNDCNALFFDGSNNVQGTLPANPGGLPALTVEAWVLLRAPITSGSMPVVNVWNHSADQCSFEMSLLPGTLEFCVFENCQSSSCISMSANVPPETWVHLAGVYDPVGGVRAFVNGQQMGTSATIPLNSLSNPTAPLHVGEVITPLGNVEHLRGSVAAVRVAAAPLYTTPFMPPLRIPSHPSDRVRWMMDEAGGTTLTDASGHSVSGNVTGAQWRIDGPGCPVAYRLPVVPDACTSLLRFEGAGMAAYNQLCTGGPTVMVQGPPSTIDLSRVMPLGMAMLPQGGQSLRLVNGRLAAPTGTIEMQIRPDQLGGVLYSDRDAHTEAFNGCSGSNPGVEVQLRSDGSVRATVGGPSSCFSATTLEGLEPDEWTHLAVQMSNNGPIEIFFDGRRVLQSVNVPWATGPTDSRVAGGNMSGSGCCFFTGSVDEVKLSNTRRY